jgi:ferrous iron transport protein B
MSVSIVTGLAAKEIVVGTMGVLYHADTDSDESTQNLADKLKNALHASGPLKGQPVFTPAAALAFIAFVLLYFPCMATIATIRRESGSWRWALFTMFYTTGVAWLVAFIVYRLGGYFTGGL